MREINWEMLGPVLAQMMFNVVVTTFVCTVFAALFMKYFVRPVPILSHAIIFFWAMFRVMLVVVVLTLVGAILGISAGALSSVFSLMGIGAVGWLITQHLAKSYGTPTKFPAVGAKVMFSLFVLVWVLVGAFFLLAR